MGRGPRAQLHLCTGRWRDRATAQAAVQHLCLLPGAQLGGPLLLCVRGARHIPSPVLDPLRLPCTAPAPSLGPLLTWPSACHAGGPAEEEAPGEEFEEDAADREARRKAAAEAARLAELLKRSNVLQRGLPRPASLDLLPQPRPDAPLKP